MTTALDVEAPGPGGGYLLGCLRPFRADPAGLLLRSARRYGDVVRMRIGPVVAHLINHPDHIEQVLVRRHHNYDKRTRSVAKMRATCGESLLSSVGESWRGQRRLIQPVFHPRSVQQFAPVVREETARMLDRWAPAAKEHRPLEIVSEMMRVTMSVAARCLFGADVDGETEIVERCLGIILDDTWRRLESWVDLAGFSSAFHRRSFRDALRSIDDVVYRVIRARRRAPGGDDLLSRLIRSGEQGGKNELDDRNLRDACVTLLLAGHETTANALAWSCRLLAESETVQADLRRELRDGLRHRPPRAEDLDELSLLDRVFQETLRLYPSIWLMERRVVADDRLGGFPLPAGSTVLISPYVLHRHEDFWPDAERFDPDRFRPTECSARPPLAYLPFGAGPHQCVGRSMALLVGRLILAMVFQRFRLRLAPGQSIQAKPGITLRHARGLEMTIDDERCGELVG